MRWRLFRLYVWFLICTAGLGRCKSEAEAETKLAKHLRKKGLTVEQQVHKDGAIVDILVKNVPIEIKYRPSGVEMDRLVGQLSRYVRVWGNVIAVLVKSSRDDQRRIETYAPRGVTVVRC